MNKDKKIIELKSLVEAAEISLQQARKILIELSGTEEEKMLMEQAKQKGSISHEEEGQIIEGIFDGQNMVGPDGKKYSVPANYASKSKLVEGDKLKLTITPDGSFLYKQIKLLDRDRIIGDLIMDEEAGEFRVLANNKSYKVLNASITYFKGEPGNKVTLLIPAGRESSWAAVENIFKADEQEPVTEGNVLNKIEETQVKDDKLDEVDNNISDDNDIKQKEQDLKLEHSNEKNNVVVENSVGENKEDKNDEFLTYNTNNHIAVDDEKKLDLNNDENEVIKKQPTDIFEATGETNTDDIKQVNIPKEEQPFINPTEVDNSNINSNLSVDNQGLDEI